MAVLIFTEETRISPARLKVSAWPHAVVSSPEKTIVVWPLGLITSTDVTKGACQVSKISMLVA